VERASGTSFASTCGKCLFSRLGVSRCVWCMCRGGVDREGRERWRAREEGLYASPKDSALALDPLATFACEGHLMGPFQARTHPPTRPLRVGRSQLPPPPSPSRPSILFSLTRQRGLTLPSTCTDASLNRSPCSGLAGPRMEPRSSPRWSTPLPRTLSESRLSASRPSCRGPITTRSPRPPVSLFSFPRPLLMEASLDRMDECESWAFELMTLLVCLSLVSVPHVVLEKVKRK
jgi:hypothetical protein